MSKTGIFLDVPDAEYFAIDAHSQSSLKPLLVSPAEYKWRLQYGIKVSDAMRWGKALDACMSNNTTDVLNKPPFLIIPKDYADKRLKPYKEWIKKQEITDDTIILSHDDAEAVNSAYEALWLHSSEDLKASSMLFAEKAIRQAVIIWEDEIGLCKAKLDCYNPDYGLIDLKTTHKPLDNAGKSIATYGYHIQAAWYLRGWHILTGQSLPWWFVWVKSTPVHQVEIGMLDKKSIAVGNKQIEKIIVSWRRCNETGHWPSTTGKVHTYSLPGYYKE